MVGSMGWIAREFYLICSQRTCLHQSLFACLGFDNSLRGRFVEQYLYRIIVFCFFDKTVQDAILVETGGYFDQLKDLYNVLAIAWALIFLYKDFFKDALAVLNPGNLFEMHGSVWHLLVGPRIWNLNFSDLELNHALQILLCRENWLWLSRIQLLELVRLLIRGFIALGVFGSRLDDSIFHKSAVRYTDFLQMSKEIGYGL